MAASHSMEDVLAAGKRSAEKSLQSTAREAEHCLIDANRRGMDASSGHLDAVERIAVDGYARLCEDAANRVASLINQGPATYVPGLENLLRGYWTTFANLFLRYAAPGEGLVRNEANLVANRMDARLEVIMRDVLADFRLRSPSEGVDMASRPDNKPMNRGRIGYSASVLKVMIASPSDVAPERTIVRDVVHEWNAVHSEDRSIVLMPIGWETHSSPAMGARPQEIINKQILQGCDLLIAVFWTKFGTPTGKAGSGTAEEIEEHLKSGKPALIYFSSEPVHPDSIDPEQYRALKAFEAGKLQEGLIERYETKSEFREKLTRQLAQTIIREFGRKDGDNGLEDDIVSDAVAVRPAKLALSEAAEELLLEAAQDKGGIIMRVQFLGGSEVQTNGRQFIASGDARATARWRAAVDELEALGFVDDRAGKGEVFFLTDEGYQAADRLAKGV